MPVLICPNHFPEKVNNKLHPHDTICVLPATSSHPSPMIMLNLKFVKNKNFSPYNVLAIILHEVGHIAGEKQNSNDEMEREFGADEFAAKHIGRDCLIETIDKDILELSTTPSSIRKNERMKRLSQKRQYLMQLSNLPTGTNQRILFDIFPNETDRSDFVIRTCNDSSHTNGIKLK